MKEPEILYRDEDIIVVVKPAGMASQPDRSLEMDMVNWLRNYLASSRPPAPHMPQVNVIHRLDRPVGGVMVYALNDRSAARLSAQLQEGIIYKEYIAVLTGMPGGYSKIQAQASCEMPGSGREIQAQDFRGMRRLEDYIIRRSGKNISRIASENEKSAQKAVLDYEILSVSENHSDRTGDGNKVMVRIHLLTGRHHQIRLQMAHAGAGIWGDTKYNPAFSGRKGKFELALFAHRLEFTHPVSRERLSFTAELPEYITRHFS